MIAPTLQKDESNRKPELKLMVPDVLKMVLVDDWEAVTKNHQVSLFLSYRTSWISHPNHGASEHPIILFILSMIRSYL